MQSRNKSITDNHRSQIENAQRIQEKGKNTKGKSQRETRKERGHQQRGPCRCCYGVAQALT